MTAQSSTGKEKEAYEQNIKLLQQHHDQLRSAEEDAIKEVEKELAKERTEHQERLTSLSSAQTNAPAKVVNDPPSYTTDSANMSQEDFMSSKIATRQSLQVH